MRNSFVKKTIVTVLIISLIPFAIFTAILINMVQSFEEERLEDSLNMIISEKMQTMKKDLQKVESEVNNLAQWAQETAHYPVDSAQLSADYQRNRQNVLEASGKETSTYLPSHIPLTEEIATEIIQTEAMVPAMASMVRQNGELAYVYTVTARGFMRVYPYLDNQIFAPDHDQRTDPFYTIANQPHNLNSANWTKPYYDYGGNGWIITCSQSYYRQDGTSGGVVCADVILDKLVQSIVDFRIGDSGFAFIIDENGGVVYHPYMEAIKGNMGDTFQINYAENYQESPVRKQLLKAMQADKSGLVSFNAEGRKKAVVFERLDTIDWIVGIEIDKEEYSVGREYLTVGVWAVLFILLILVSILGSLLSRRIIAPILKLTENVKKMDQGNLVPLPVDTSDEVGMLASAFNSMGQKLGQYTGELIYSKNQLESVFNSIDDTMMILDGDYGIKKINKGRLEEGGLACCYQILRGQEEPCRNCPVGDTARLLNKHKSEVACGGDIFEVASYPVLDEEGKLKEIVVFEKSVTGEKLMEKELFQSEKMAVIGQMVAGVTHELKTPLAVIKGASFLLKGGADGKEWEEIMGEMDANLARAEKIVYNMLDFSKSSWGESRLHDSRKLLDQLYMLVRQECVRKGISVQLNTGEEPVNVFGNSDSLKNIFLNIMTNALEAMEEGGKLTIQANYTQEGNVCVYFRNTGTQILEENLGKIFEPFFTTKEKGTGLGLWLVYKEVIRSRGSIKVTNQPDGVEVRILLPGGPEENNVEGDVRV
ncbi:HAMP domain-containing protein [Aminipila butyrica]|uniref:histidine kinase n=1 Tax=Aminipila butyrica TaxID=433296 RepID=A0A858BZ21_9FIRM|nr:sensor histidine kinase [Aminipila butyrica]QIB70160.1 HAMP domain-containing protein [Aminipila butyrica]